MALFERENTEFGSDVGTRALSVIAVENHFVERVYEKLASVYDLIFGPTLHPGMQRAVEGIRLAGLHLVEPLDPADFLHQIGLAMDVGPPARNAADQ